jgi:glycerophosphoryl diester phosphodiesterase
LGQNGLVAIVIAHRGGRGGPIENTLEAIDSAIGAGADMVEVDCRLTRDGKVVVLHDETLTRLWRARASVHDLDWAQLADLRRQGCRVPQLAEVLAHVELPLMLDIPDTSVVEAVFEVVGQAGALDRCVFAGRVDALRRLRQLAPTARIALSWDRGGFPSPSLLQSVKPEWYNPHWRKITSEAVRRARSQGLAVSVWTVNHRWSMKRVLRAGVDAVITDQVPKLIDEIARRSS